MSLRVPSDNPLWSSAIIIRPDDPDAAQRLARYEATLRDRMGEEAFERWKRSEALSENPRPLSDPEKRVLRGTLAPLLRDLEATGHSLPDIREEAHEDRGDDGVCAWIQGPGGCGEGLSVEVYLDEPTRLERLAEQLQGWKNDELFDAGRRPWPQCPDHPGPCALTPDVRDDIAVWYCPENGRVVAEIGSLGQQ